MTNPYEAPPEATAANHKAFVFFQRPRNPTVYTCIFVAIFIGALFVPTVELFQLKYSLGRVPLWYAYVGLLAPEYWMIAIPIVIAHLIGTIVLSSVLERHLTSRLSNRQPRGHS